MGKNDTKLFTIIVCTKSGLQGTWSAKCPLLVHCRPVHGLHGLVCRLYPSIYFLSILMHFATDTITIFLDQTDLGIFLPGIGGKKKKLFWNW